MLSANFPATENPVTGKEFIASYLPAQHPLTLLSLFDFCSILARLRMFWDISVSYYIFLEARQPLILLLAFVPRHDKVPLVQHTSSPQRRLLRKRTHSLWPHTDLMDRRTQRIPWSLHPSVEVDESIAVPMCAGERRLTLILFASLVFAPKPPIPGTPIEFLSQESYSERIFYCSV